jgi:hypothetical protein
MSAIPTKAREMVWERQMRACARCGNRGYQIHHRQRRREGGHAVGNLVGTCRVCHEWCHAHPDKAREQGYVVTVSVDDPSLIPIRTYMGWVLFDNDGGIRFVEEPERMLDGP